MNTIFDEQNNDQIRKDNRFAIKCLTYSLAGLSLFGAIFFSLVKLSDEPTDPTAPKEGAIRALSSLGIEPISSFQADGVVGHGFLHQGTALVAYEAPDSNNIFIGDMFSEHGANLTELHKNEFLLSHIAENALPLLEESHYVVDSDSHDGVVIYTITDPQCPFCLRLWDTMRPYVEKGEIELRHVIVGIQGEISVTSAAAILNADSPHEMLNDYLSAKRDGGQLELPQISEEDMQKVWDNNEIMRAVGAGGTPASYITYPDGSSEYISGAFGDSKVEEIISKSNSLKE